MEVKKKIFITEDHAILRAGLKALLESNPSYEVVGEADNGPDAIRYVAETSPDLVLMDVVMPGMNGFQATRQLTRQSETAKIPVIIVTTKDQETDKVWAKRQGARDYIVKPVLLDDLRKRLNVILTARGLEAPGTSR